MNYKDYKAAAERLRRVASGEESDDVYNGVFASIGGDKLTIYDAEHDREPATVEWLLDVGEYVYGTPKMGHYIKLGEKTIWIDKDGRLVDGCPTRGDVLTALRLFGKKEGDA